MNTIFGNFIEKTLPNLRDALIKLVVGTNETTMNLEDFKTLMAPEPNYKVYTALLTQSGGNGEGYNSGGDLTIGVSYRINTLAIGMDFTNVGALNNDIGTWFVATGTTPNSWGIDGDEVLFYNTGAPTVTVLENTIGNIWFRYNDVGYYYISSNGLFTLNKIFSFNNNVRYYYPANDGFFILKVAPEGTADIAFSTITDGLNSENNFLEEQLIEIRVYN